jgi:hypothetical protein
LAKLQRSQVSKVRVGDLVVIQKFSRLKFRPAVGPWPNSMLLALGHYKG